MMTLFVYCLIGDACVCAISSLVGSIARPKRVPTCKLPIARALRSHHDIIRYGDL